MAPPDLLQPGVAVPDDRPFPPSDWSQTQGEQQHRFRDYDSPGRFKLHEGQGLFSKPPGKGQDGPFPSDGQAAQRQGWTGDICRRVFCPGSYYGRLCFRKTVPFRNKHIFYTGSGNSHRRGHNHLRTELLYGRNAGEGQQGHHCHQRR